MKYIQKYESFKESKRYLDSELMINEELSWDDLAKMGQQAKSKIKDLFSQRKMTKDQVIASVRKNLINVATAAAILGLSTSDVQAAVTKPTKEAQPTKQEASVKKQEVQKKQDAISFESGKKGLQTQKEKMGGDGPGDPDELKVEVLDGSTSPTSCGNSVLVKFGLDMSGGNNSSYYECTLGDLMNNFGLDSNVIMKCFKLSKETDNSLGNTDPDFVKIGGEQISGKNNVKGEVNKFFDLRNLDPNTKIIARRNGLLAISRILRQSEKGTLVELFKIGFQTERASETVKFDLGSYFKTLNLTPKILTVAFRATNVDTFEKDSPIDQFNLENLVGKSIDEQAEFIKNMYRKYTSELIPENQKDKFGFGKNLVDMNIDVIKKMIEAQKGFKGPGLNVEAYKKLILPELERILRANSETIGKTFFGARYKVFTNRFASLFGFAKGDEKEDVTVRHKPLQDYDGQITKPVKSQQYGGQRGTELKGGEKKYGEGR